MRVFDTIVEAYKQGYRFYEKQPDGYTKVIITITQGDKLARGLALVKPA